MLVIVAAVTVAIILGRESGVDLHAVPGSCTIFAASQGDTILFGNNEDWMLPTTFYWIRLPGKDTYGGVYLGHRSAKRIRSDGLMDISPQGGVNEKVLLSTTPHCRKHR